MRRILYLLILFTSYNLSAQPFRLVRDINTSRTFSNDPGSVSTIAELSGYLYVAISYWPYGKELWKIDKLSGNKQIVKDINLGLAGSQTPEVFVYNNLLFFSANSGSTGEELWKSDGTAQGTSIVKDIKLGTIGSFPKGFFIYNNSLIFVANGELWKSDGTEQGTVVLKDIYPGPVESNPSNFCINNGILYFAASDPQNGRELWRSDGTTDGTYMVTDIFPGQDLSGWPNGASPYAITTINGYIVFSASEATHGREIWTSDGTAIGTKLLKDLNPGIGSSSHLHSSAVFGNKLYFSVAVNGSVELWLTDGTPQNTLMVLKLYQTPLGWINNIISFKGSLFLRTYASGFGDEIWKSDGTSTGTQKFLHMNSSNIQFGLIADDNYLYYLESKANTEELWVTDGTSAPPRSVKVIDGSYGNIPIEPQLINGRIYFQVTSSLNGISIWKSDGSSVGTLPVIREGTDNANPFYLTAFKNEIYFTANDSIHGTEVWKSDGTEAGTTLLKDIVPGSGSSYPINFIAADTNLFFIPLGAQLWKTNGTPEGTLRVQPQANAYAEHEMKLLNGLVYFVGSRGGSIQIWRTDGTDAGTVPADNSFAYSSVEELVAFKETIFFRGYNGASGWELWKIDKTSGRAKLLKDIWQGTNSGYPRNFTVTGNYLYFTAENGFSGVELWRTDGTEAGTIMLEILSGSSTSLPVWLTALGNEIYFVASDSVHGTELWKSNGTIAGTSLVKDIHPGTSSSYISNLFSFDGKLFFDLYDPATGNELWKSDGTADGTAMLIESWPGPNGNNLAIGYQAILPNGIFVLTRANEIYGLEPWVSDGTSTGTVISQDLFPGTGSSGPIFYTVAGNKIYFRAYIPDFGTELWTGDIYDLYPKLQLIFSGELQNNNAILNWQTTHERLLDRFEIQRSLDRISFTKLGQFNPKGGLGISADYSFVDSNITQLNQKLVHYRLGIRDTSGNYSYSDTVSLTIPDIVTSNSIKAWPMPSRGDLNISIALVESDDINFVLYDLQGRAVKKWSGHFEKGISSKTIHLQVLNAGVYYLSVQGRLLQQLIKVIKM